MKRITQTQPGERLLYPPVVYSYNHPFAVKGEPIPIPCPDYVACRISMAVGNHLVMPAGEDAVLVQITRMDHTGVYGVELARK